MSNVPFSVGESRTSRSQLRPLFQIGVAIAVGLIGYGVWLVPATNRLSIVAASVVIAIYSFLGFVVPDHLGEHQREVRAVGTFCGLLAGVVFAVEIILEYVLLPADNTNMGLAEFGTVFSIYSLAGGVTAYRSRSLRAGTLAAMFSSVVSSLIWWVIVLGVFYCFFGTPQQDRVFRAEGNYSDFANSGMTDFNAWVMEDIFGAGFYHLLLGPIIAGALGFVGACAAVAVRRIRRAQGSAEGIE
jgi:hypothetical protein